jgi:hypothetical protein
MASRSASERTASRQAASVHRGHGLGQRNMDAVAMARDSRVRRITSRKGPPKAYTARPANSQSRQSRRPTKPRKTLQGCDACHSVAILDDWAEFQGAGDALGNGPCLKGRGERAKLKTVLSLTGEHRDGRSEPLQFMLDKALEMLGVDGAGKSAKLQENRFAATRCRGNGSRRHRGHHHREPMRP